MPGAARAAWQPKYPVDLADTGGFDRRGALAARRNSGNATWRESKAARECRALPEGSARRQLGGASVATFRREDFGSISVSEQHTPELACNSDNATCHAATKANSNVAAAMSRRYCGTILPSYFCRDGWRGGLDPRYEQLTVFR
jgi:hypothetical protein